MAINRVQKSMGIDWWMYRKMDLLHFDDNSCLPTIQGYMLLAEDESFGRTRNAETSNPKLCNCNTDDLTLRPSSTTIEQPFISGPCDGYE
jgi:hypothetical protein